jgi:hypothetical protein
MCTGMLNAMKCRTECGAGGQLILKPRLAELMAVAAEVGYADGVTLRALLRRRLGRGVREICHSL